MLLISPLMPVPLLNVYSTSSLKRYCWE